MADHRSQIIQKWRPSLLMVIGVSLVCCLFLAVFGFLILRWITPIVGWRIGVLAVSIVLGTAVAVLAVLQWRLLLRPIRDLAKASRYFAQGRSDDAPALEHYGTSELRDLGQSVLNMAKELTNQKRTLQGYADHVVHELKSPVTALHGAAELLADDDLPDQQRKLLFKDISDSTKRMAALLDGLHAHARSQASDTSGTCIICELDAVRVPGVQVFGEAHLPLKPEACEVIFQQLIDNALAAGATRIDICALRDGVAVADNGAGIPESHAEKVFDPFFTTKRNIGGTGMGLPIVKTMLESGGCTVALWQKNGGTVLSVHV